MDLYCLNKMIHWCTLRWYGKYFLSVISNRVKSAKAQTLYANIIGTPSFEESRVLKVEYLGQITTKQTTSQRPK